MERDKHVADLKAAGHKIDLQRDSYQATMGTQDAQHSMDPMNAPSPKGTGKKGKQLPLLITRIGSLTVLRYLDRESPSPAYHRDTI